MISFTRINNGASAELIAHKKNRIITLILLSFAALIYGFGTEGSLHSTHPSELGVFIYFSSLLCLFSACTNCFKDTHDRPSADVQLSMPLSNTERYLSRLLTISYIWIIPFLASAAVATIISVIINSLDYTNEYTPVYAANALKYDLIYAFWFLAAALFIISVTVLCQCCTGSKAESKYTPVILMFALSLAPVVIYEFADNYTNITVGSRSIPIFALWSFSGLAVDLDDITCLPMIAVNALISIAAIAASLFIYRKRDARSVGTPVTFPLFLEFIIVCSLAMLFCLVHIDKGIDTVTLFLSWLGSIILRIITARKNFSIRKIGIWSLIFAAYYAVFLILMYIVFRTGNFGQIYKKADFSDCIGAETSLSISIDETYSYYRNDDMNYNYYSYVTFDHVGNNAAAEDKIMDICSEYAHIYSSTPGIFSSRMFNTRLDRFAHCSVSISHRYIFPEGHSEWIDNRYQISLLIPLNDAKAMSEELAHAELMLENAKYKD